MRAPGRVNLIGEHTDYNDGFTMPMALPFDTVVAVTATADQPDGPITVVSAGFGEVTFAIDAKLGEVARWAWHLVGVVRLLAQQGVPAGGWQGTIDSDIPSGASLSSSAALEVATTTALLARAGLAWSALDVARLGVQVENEVIGLPSGIMDQFISAGAVAGHACLMDCRALTLRPVPLDASATVVVLDTCTRRVLADVAYGDRRATCQAAAAHLGVPALRDATLDQVLLLPDPVERRRARHVVTENQRTLDAAAALDVGDMGALGRLMSASHASLRDDYEVSGPALDVIVEIAEQAPGCLGARMTGGGFAGCAVALVETAHVASFGEFVFDRYRFDGQRARVWPCAASGGASVISRPGEPG